MKQRRFNPLLVLAVVAALLLGACSSGGDDDETVNTDSTEAEANGDDETTTTAGDDDGEGDDSDDGDETTTTEGDDDDDDDGGSVDVGSDGQAYVDAMIASMKSDDEFPLSDEQAECFSTGFVNTIGVDRLQAAGITPDDMASDDSSLEFTELNLTEEEGNTIYDGFGDCGINLREIMLESMSADEDMTPEMQACIEGVFTDDNLRTLMVVTMTQGEDAIEDDPAVSGIMSGMMGCAFMGMDTGDMGEG